LKLLTCDNVEIIELQIVIMEIGGFGEKLRSLEEMKKWKADGYVSAYVQDASAVNCQSFP